MRIRIIGGVLLLLLLVGAGYWLLGPRSGSRPLPAPIASPFERSAYPGSASAPEYEPLAARYRPPHGYRRVSLEDNGWGRWLRFLPLAPEGRLAETSDGDPVFWSRAFGAMLDLDVLRFQECADTIMRLRAEYLRYAGREDEIAFRLSDGGRSSWSDWKQGDRPEPQGDHLVFDRTATPDDSDDSFRAYLVSVFTWCGTYNLASEGRPVPRAHIQVGDFLVHGGSPGHAVLLVDLAENEGGDLVGLFVEGLIPAQSAHVVRGPLHGWVPLPPDQALDLLYWGPFDWDELRRWD